MSICHTHTHTHTRTHTHTHTHTLQPKYTLIKDTVEVVGVERSVEFFKQTAEIQKHGGVLNADKDKKSVMSTLCECVSLIFCHRRAPGGVFFSLVKSSVSEEEKKQIFAKDNRLTAKQAKRTREAKRRKKWREKEEKQKKELQDKARKELELFRRDLSVGEEMSEKLEQSPDGNKERKGKEQRREDYEPEYTDLDDPSCQEDGELTEGWRNVGMDDNDDDFTSRITEYEHLQRKMAPSHRVEEMDTKRVSVERREGSEEVQGRRGEVWIEDEVGGTRDGVSLEEKMAAEHFERTNECDFDLGIDLD